MSAVLEALSIAVQANIPALIWGPPGVGKTSAIEALADSLGLPCEVVIASIREPADFSGLPVITNGSCKLVPPEWAYRLAKAGRGIVFFDEASTAPPANQAGLLRVILNGVVGDLPLPPAVARVAAANPPEQAAGGWDLSAPLANRFCHLTWSLDPRSWVDGTLNGWPTPKYTLLPESWESQLIHTRSLVAAFVRARPHLLFQFPKDEAKAGRAWPSPRTWTRAYTLMAASRSIRAGDEPEILLVSGCVGDGPAMEFLSWVQALDLPDPEDVLAAPDRFKVPERGDRAFAVLSSVVAAALADLTPKRWSAAWTVLARAAEQGAADVGAAAARALATARNGRADLPLPLKQLSSFLPILKAAGIL